MNNVTTEVSDAACAGAAEPQESVGTLVNRRTMLEMPGPALQEVHEASDKAESGGADAEGPKHSVRLLPLVDHDQSKPTGTKTVLRTLRGDGTIRLGRTDSVREGEPRPIVYGSKVVSRAHAELILENGQWYARDIGSSSGTWLNSQRLGQPSAVSERRPLRSGDVLQFGVNYRGGAEPQFRAIKVRVQIDGGSDRKPSTFHAKQFAQLRTLVGQPSPQFESCVICLQEMSPLDALFVSPCCHMWHYRCIRSVLVKRYPFFECPVCRDTFDLEEADISEEDGEADSDK